MGEEKTTDTHKVWNAKAKFCSINQVKYIN